MAKLAILILIYASSQAAFAWDGEDRFPTPHEPASIAELIPDFEDLRCKPKCGGPVAACGQFVDADSCLIDGAQMSCSWSCE